MDYIAMSDKYKRRKVILQIKSSPSFRIGSRKHTQPLTLRMTVDKKSIEMELETGAAVS